VNRILITGVSGFLGWNLCQKLLDFWQVYGTYYTHPVQLPGANFQKVDLTNFQAVKQLFSEVKPATVIHTAAASQPNFCQEFPEESARINVTASINIAGLCAEENIPCIFTSTELVFDGLHPPYCESDPTSPINYYGEQKVRAEQGMLACYPQTAICRMPLMFGPASPSSGSFIQPFIEILKQGQELTLFVDEIRTPISAKTATLGLLLAIETQVSGILHLGGKERISRYQFGCLMADILQLPRNQIKPCYQADVPMAAPRAPDVSLDSSLAFSLGYNPPSLELELRQFAKMRCSY
jgi:dTDP-4-dehydrorhamnose reductase